MREFGQEGRREAGRFKSALDRFAALVTAAFFVLMAWQYVRFWLEMRETAQVIAVLRWSVWPWWAAVALFITLAAVAAVLTAWQRRPEEGERE